jgi:gamma-glutamyltranspeptidase/glutathione hydrolase
MAETVAREGSRGFYDGPIAPLIVEELKKHGGIMELDDLAKHNSTWTTPISVVYKDVRC